MPPTSNTNRERHDALVRWRDAGLLDEHQMAAIEAFEAARDTGTQARLRWPAILALTFGVLMVGAGSLLFIAAHWDTLAPSTRFLTVLVKVGLFHAAGAYFATRMPRLSMALHALGTVALGAAIHLSGQIFNLQEHWPGGLMLWAAGAWLGWWLLRDWIQGLLVALLTPAWLAAEWTEATRTSWPQMESADLILAVGLFLLALGYLTWPREGRHRTLGRALVWIGGLACIPAALALVEAVSRPAWRPFADMPSRLALIGWSLSLGLPLALAAWQRRKGVWMNLVAGTWAVLFTVMDTDTWPIFAWCALGAIGLAGWGLRERRRACLNLGLAGFAITLLVFYFSDVMDKLGRSLGLMGLGLLFLVGGWQLERLRRALEARIQDTPHPEVNP